MSSHSQSSFQKQQQKCKIITNNDEKKNKNSEGVNNKNNETIARNVQLVNALATLLPPLFLEARVFGGGQQPQELVTQLGLSMAASPSLDVAIFTRTSGAAFAVGIGSFVAYKMLCRLVRSNCIWTALEQLSPERESEHEQQPSCSTTVGEPFTLAEGFYAVRLGGENELLRRLDEYLSSDSSPSTSSFSCFSPQSSCAGGMKECNSKRANEDYRKARVAVVQVRQANALKQLFRRSQRLEGKGIAALEEEEEQQQQEELRRDVPDWDFNKEYFSAKRSGNNGRRGGGNSENNNIKALAVASRGDAFIAHKRERRVVGEGEGSVVRGKHVETSCGDMERMNFCDEREKDEREEEDGELSECSSNMTSASRKVRPKSDPQNPHHQLHSPPPPPPPLPDEFFSDSEVEASPSSRSSPSPPCPPSFSAPSVSSTGRRRSLRSASLRLNCDNELCWEDEFSENFTQSARQKLSVGDRALDWDMEEGSGDEGLFLFRERTDSLGGLSQLSAMKNLERMFHNNDWLSEENNVGSRGVPDMENEEEEEEEEEGEERRESLLESALDDLRGMSSLKDADGKVATTSRCSSPLNIADKEGMRRRRWNNVDEGREEPSAAVRRSPQMLPFTAYRIVLQNRELSETSSSVCGGSSRSGAFGRHCCPSSPHKRCINSNNNSNKGNGQQTASTSQGLWELTASGKISGGLHSRVAFEKQRHEKTTGRETVEGEVSLLVAPPAIGASIGGGPMVDSMLSVNSRASSSAVSSSHAAQLRQLISGTSTGNSIKPGAVVAPGVMFDSAIGTDFQSSADDDDWREHCLGCVGCGGEERRREEVKELVGEEVGEEVGEKRGEKTMEGGTVDFIVGAAAPATTITMKLLLLPTTAEEEQRWLQPRLRGSCGVFRRYDVEKQKEKNEEKDDDNGNKNSNGNIRSGSKSSEPQSSPFPSPSPSPIPSVEFTPVRQPLGRRPPSPSQSVDGSQQSLEWF